MIFNRRVYSLLLSLLLAACASVPDGQRSPSGSASSTDSSASASAQQAQPALGIDGVACVGQAPSSMSGMQPIQDAALVAKAQMKTGAGGVCTAQAFKAEVPVKVFRVFDGTKPWSAMGGWWALTRPQGPRDAYRELNAICPSWSALDELVSCDVKPGSALVLGTTQSVECPDGKTYPKTAEIQVYMPNDTRNNQLYVENCTKLGAWPGAQ